MVTDSFLLLGNATSSNTNVKAVTVPMVLRCMLWLKGGSSYTCSKLLYK